jgi:hypothetical protein
MKETKTDTKKIDVKKVTVDNKKKKGFNFKPIGQYFGSKTSKVERTTDAVFTRGIATSGTVNIKKQTYPQQIIREAKGINVRI